MLRGVVPGFRIARDASVRRARSAPASLLRQRRSPGSWQTLTPPGSSAQLERDGPLERVRALAGRLNRELVALAQPGAEDARRGHRRRQTAAVRRAPPRDAFSGVVEAEIQRGADL